MTHSKEQIEAAIKWFNQEVPPFYKPGYEHVDTILAALEQYKQDHIVEANEKVELTCKSCKDTGEWFGNDGQAGPFECDCVVEQYKQPPVSNEEALGALGRMRLYKFYSTEKKIRYSADFEEWAKTIRTALTNPPAKTVDVEGVKKDVGNPIDDGLGLVCHQRGWNDCIDHLIEKGLINAE